MSRARRKTTAHVGKQSPPAGAWAAPPGYPPAPGDYGAAPAGPGPAPAGGQERDEFAHGLRGRLFKLVTKGRGGSRVRDLASVSCVGRELVDRPPARTPRLELFFRRRNPGERARSQQSRRGRGRRRRNPGAIPRERARRTPARPVRPRRTQVRGEPCEAVEGAAVVQVFPTGFSALVGAAALLVAGPPSKRPKTAVAASSRPADELARLYRRSAGESEAEASDLDRLLSHRYGTALVRSGRCLRTRADYLHFYRTSYGARLWDEDEGFERVVWARAAARRLRPDYKRRRARDEPARAAPRLSEGATTPPPPPQVTTRDANEPEFRQRSIRAETGRLLGRRRFVVKNAPNGVVSARYVDAAGALRASLKDLDIVKCARLTRAECVAAAGHPSGLLRGLEVGLARVPTNAAAAKSLQGGLVPFLEVALRDCRASADHAKVAAAAVQRAGFNGLDASNVAILADLLGA